MNEPVIIKGNKYGISLVLDQETDFQVIRNALIEKLSESRKFFGNAKVFLSVTGRELLDKESQVILGIFKEYSDLKVVCLVDQGFEEMKEEEREDLLQKKVEIIDEEVKVEKEVYNEEIIKQDTNGEITEDNNQIMDSLIANNASCFHKGTVRSGQEINSDSSIVIIGNVNDGAKVISKGNVIVIGKLSGFVVAGSDGDNNAFVVALNMAPRQIKIGTRIARSDQSNKMPTKVNQYYPQIAFVEGTRIVIEDVSSNTYENLKY